MTYVPDFVSHPPMLLAQLDLDPVVQFHTWFAKIEKDTSIRNPDAACLSTLDEAGYPDGRMVLVRQVDKDGFVFYTNRHSSKGHSIEKLPKASLTYYWARHGKQVRVRGNVVRLDDEQADDYFNKRPRGSQLAAWASDQSEVIHTEGELKKRYLELESTYAERPIERPPFWIGYRIVPIAIEFWLEQSFRLHDRVLYRKQKTGDWTKERLFP